MSVDSVDDQEANYVHNEMEAIHENHSELHELSIYRNTETNDTLATPRSDSDLSSNRGQKPHTVLPRCATFSSVREVGDNNSLYCSRARSRSFTFGVTDACKETSKCHISNEISRNNPSVDACHNAESRQHRNCENFRTRNTDKQIPKCPTQANLPSSKDPSIQSARCTPQKQLNGSDKPPHILFETSVNRPGGDIGDKKHNQSKKDKRGHKTKRTRKRSQLAEIQLSSIPDTVPTCSSHPPLQRLRSSTRASNDSDSDENTSTPKTKHTRITQRPRRSKGEIHEIRPKRNFKCHHTYSDNPAIDKNLPTTSGGTAAHTIQGSNMKQHGRASTNQDIHVHSTKDEHVVPLKQHIPVRGRQSDKATLCVPSVCRGEAKSKDSDDDSEQREVSQPIQDSDDDGEQREVSQPIQETSHDWAIPLIVQGNIMHYQNNVVEQSTEEDESSHNEPPSFPYPAEELQEDQSSSEMALPRPPRVSIRRNLSAIVPPTHVPISIYNEQSTSSHEPLASSCQIVLDTNLSGQSVHFVGVLVENAVNYCTVSCPRCRNSLCTRTDHNIFCQLQSVLQEARCRLVQVELRFYRIRRRLVASPSHIECSTIVLFRHVICQLQQTVQEVHITHNRYHQSQIRFQRILVMIQYFCCQSQYAERLHQLQQSCCVQTCQHLENMCLYLERIGHLLSTLIGQLQPSVVAMPFPPAQLPLHNPQAAAQPALLVDLEHSLEHFQVNTEEKSRELVSDM